MSLKEQRINKSVTLCGEKLLLHPRLFQTPDLSVHRCYVENKYTSRSAIGSLMQLFYISVRLNKVNGIGWALAQIV